MKIRAGIIPHPGEKYGGKLRKKVFNVLKESNPQLIIYISAIHDTSNLSNKIYELKQDNFYKKIAKRKIKVPRYEKLNKPEHSYGWVEKEIKLAFPNAGILVLTPVGSNHHKMVHLLTTLMKAWKDLIIIATTDLIHYGENFNNVDMLQVPQQLFKVKKEQHFINALAHSKSDVHNFFKQNHLMCGPYAIELYIKVMQKLKYTGKVVDYYDSSTIDFKKEINIYTIFPEPTPNFVSYVGLVYGPTVKQSIITEFDIIMAIAAVKSVILRDIANQTYDIQLPIWSPFYNKTQGVFVGTSDRKGTTCSYGRYETNDKQSTALKITAAAHDCKRDASDRWNRPYILSKMNNVEYKGELLAEKSSWKKYSSNKAPEVVPLDGNPGVYLQLKSGESATYLPVVSKENPKWTIDKYMTSLAKKAGDVNGDWKNGTIYVYDSVEFYA